MRILLVEDDTQVSTVLAATLVRQSHVVDIATDGQEGWEMLQFFPYDLVLLDIMLPKLDGISFCRKLRTHQPDILIMLLTARSNQADRVLGLDAGADDYMIKPFDPEELVARVRALQRRGISSSPVLEWGRLRLEPAHRKFTFAGQPINLRPKEYALLELFLRNPQRIFSRREILDRLWALDDDLPDESTIKAHIKGIRRALRPVGAEHLIQTLYGQGYGLSANEAINDAPQIPPNPQAERTQMLVAEIWQQVKGLSFERLSVLQQAATALRTGECSETLRSNATQSAHQLTGALGMFGFSEGSQIAQQLEILFESDRLHEPQVIQRIADLVHDLQQYLRIKDQASSSEASSQNAASPLSASDSTPVPIQAKVLAIDDDEMLLNLLQEVLRPLGVEIIPLPSPSKLWQTLDEIQPNLVLLDVQMPEMNGLELCKAIRASEQWCWLPIIFLTVCEDFQTQSTSFEIGADDYLMKPVVPSILATRIFNRLARLQTIQQHAVSELAQL
ncbi:MULTISPECIES: response regulator [Leptolyngbya]|uniref:response regulator n=1 Tax=Leptolyngbya TaxID=47251 RepID=UPI0016820AAF|nr:response regulator [Leptolyngbya sp. FACHB-1624]MBD1856374.1 response regulator [Leptolyngbya sp. FACHB-1624]